MASRLVGASQWFVNNFEWLTDGSWVAVTGSPWVDHQTSAVIGKICGQVLPPLQPWLGPELCLDLGRGQILVRTRVMSMRLDGCGSLVDNGER